MSEIKIKRIVDVSVIGEVKDLIKILGKLDPLDIFTLESGNNETASEHLANALVDGGYTPVFGEGLARVEEKPKRSKAKGPKAPRLTKANKVSIDECYKNTVWEEGDTEDFKRKNVAADLKLNEEQVLRYFAKQAKKEKG